MIAGDRKGTKRTSNYDPVGFALKDEVGIEPGNTLYGFLHDTAATARQHRLPINLATLAFTIARSPKKLEQLRQCRDNGDVAQAIEAEIRECRDDAEQEVKT